MRMLIQPKEAPSARCVGVLLRSIWAVAVLLFALPSLNGCASLRLPQFDPSGQRIFLPPPHYTTVTLPGREICDAIESATPKAAWQEPAAPPPVQLGRPVPEGAMEHCGLLHAPPGAGPIKGICQKPLEGHVTLSPERIVAPVGSEVVLVSGLCDANGNLVTGEPIEWTLSQESVGNFVQVGERGHRVLARLISNNPRKISNDFALGRASTEARFITRGTATPDDDLPLKKGESWVSVTSAKEGVSHVTVLAPNAYNWDMRKRIATIYWVDAQWLFPTPSVARANEQHVLETVLSRGRDFSPIADWIVRYEVVGGPPAVFPAAGNDSVVEVITDADGRAAVEIMPTSNESGTTQIHISVIQPATPDGDRPRLVLGEGMTTVTWSVPRLEIKVLGPTTALGQSEAAYRIEVQNTGDIPLSNVTVVGSIDGDATLVQSAPEGAMVGDRHEWRIGDLPARTATPIDLTLRLGAGPVRLCAQVDSAEGLHADECFDTTVEAPALTVTMHGPEGGKARVGDFVEFLVDISNTSQRDLPSVTISDAFDFGLEHETGQPSPIVRDLGSLRAGESKRISVRFLVRQLGELCHVLEAVANTGERASARGCVTGMAPEEFDAGPLRVQKTGPLQARVGEVVLYTIVIENQGDRELTDLVITDEYDIALQVTRLTEDHRLDKAARTIEWRVPRIRPEEALTFQAEYRCVSPSVNAGNRVRVTTGEGHSATGEARTQIAPEVSMRMTGFNRGSSSGLSSTRRRNESWSWTIRDAEAGAEKGKLLLIVQHEGAAPVRNVYIEIAAPPGATISDARTKLAPVRRQGEDQRRIVIGPVATVRAGEELTPIEIDLRGRFDKRDLAVEVRDAGGSR